MNLVAEVETYLCTFRDVFRRQATFEGFVVITWAFMLRMEALGVSSIVRCFGLASHPYYNLLHFFHSSAFCVHDLCLRWRDIVRRCTTPIEIHGLPVVVVDGIKVGKTGLKMPGVKRLHQESDDNSKPQYIRGHFFGALSALVRAGQHVFALPLRFQIQDGLKRSPSEKASLIDKLQILIIPLLSPATVVVADAYYSTQGFLKALLGAQCHFIGRVRANTVAYEPLMPPVGPRPRGRPRTRGVRVQLKALFDCPECFRSASVRLYGELQNVRYLCRDLLWHGFAVRFVLSLYPDGTRRILLCTHRALSPEAILYAYSLRFKIEVSFKVMVQTLCAFYYHFWLKAMPKARRHAGNQYLHRAGAHYRRQVARKIEAYERFVNLCAIALGILQLLAIRFPEQVWQAFPLWLRTLPKHGCPSENVVRLTLQHELHRISLTTSNSTLIGEILSQENTTDPDADHPLCLAA